MLASTFDESEARHFDTYRNLLELVDLNEMFNRLDESAVLKSRSDSLQSVIKVPGQSRRDILLKNIMFSSFIENVSLYSQFLILKSFAEIESLFKGTANGVDATS
jgi:ribonucleoside-diphosphate reductase beta chain